MAQKKVLSVGIRATANLGDVAISDMIAKLFKSSGYPVEQMEFNFSTVVASVFRCMPHPGWAMDVAAREKTCHNNALIARALRAVGRIFKLIFYLPIVFFVFLRKSKGCAKVFIGGGNLLMGIEFGFPLQVLSYVLFSRLLGKRVVWLCVGAGPFTAPGVKPMLRLALRLSERVICRDTRSRELLVTEFGASLVALEVWSDPVLFWPKEAAPIRPGYDILFTFMPLFHPAIFRDGDHSRAENYKASMIDLMVALLNLDKRLGVFVTDADVDLEISKTIVVEVFKRTGVRLALSVPTTPSEMAVLVNSTALVLSTRMHGAIMALSQAVPALCVGWQPKVRGLYADLAMDDLLVELDDSGRLAPQAVLNQLADLAANRQYYADSIGENLSALQGDYQRRWACL